MSSDKKDKSKSKSFEVETTPVLSFEDNYDEDEVTISEKGDQNVLDSEVEEISEITVRLPSKDVDSEELSSVSQQLKRIKSLEHEQQSYLERFKDVGQSLLGFVLDVFVQIVSFLKNINLKSLQNFKPSKRSLVIGASILVVVIVVVVLGFVANRVFNRVYLPKQSASLRDRAIKSKKTQSLITSPILFFDASGDPVKNKRVHLAQTSLIRFNLLQWNGGRTHATNVAVDLKIYNEKGKLELFQPELMKYGGGADPAKFELAVEAKLVFESSVEPGFYRAQFTIVDLTTQKKKNIQTRFKVVP